MRLHPLGSNQFGKPGQARTKGQYASERPKVFSQLHHALKQYFSKRGLPQEQMDAKGKVAA
jgi:hypothetical protein